MRRPLLVLALAAVLPPAAPAAAQSPGGQEEGLFSLTPVRRNVVARPPVELLPASGVSNSTRDPYRVRVFPVLLRQELDGSFSFAEDAQSLNTARRILAPLPNRFVLAPGSQRQVDVRWSLLPRGARAAYVGLVFEGRAPRRPNQPLATVQRLLNPNFLRLPGRFRRSGSFAGLRVEQGRSRTLVVTPRVRNTGQAIAAPRSGRLVVRRVGGPVVSRASFRTEVVLPRARVDVPVTLRKVLPAGDYEVQASMRFGRSRARATQRFTLVGPNRLPTARIALRDLRGDGEVDEEARLVGTVVNEGDATFDTAVTATLFRTRAGQQETRPLARRKVELDGVEGGERRALSVPLGDLAAGDYRVRVLFRSAPGDVRRASVDFSPRADDPFTAKVGRFVRDNLLVLVLLVALALMAVALVAGRRRRGTADAGRGPTPGTVPAAATASGSAVDVNTATAEELARVEGIGPGAAARIVAHRDEYGAFGSVDALERVEGFDAERVAELRDRLSAG